jgi:hypothetical protein
VFSACFGRPHAGSHALAEERRLQFGHGADDSEHCPTHGAVGIHLILDADEAHPKVLNSSSASSRGRVLPAKRSNFQTSTQSIARFLAATISGPA